jgi:hypothetical protein
MTFDLILIGLAIAFDPIPLTTFLIVLPSGRGVRKGAASRGSSESGRKLPSPVCPVELCSGHSRPSRRARRSPADGLHTHIGTVATLDDAIPALNPVERRKGKAAIHAHP